MIDENYQRYYMMLVQLFVAFCFAVAAFASPTQILGSRSESAPNPIKSSYPDGTITGTINGTLAVIPISYDLARVS